MLSTIGFHLVQTADTLCTIATFRTIATFHMLTRVASLYGTLKQARVVLRLPSEAGILLDAPRLSPDWRDLIDRSHSDGLRVYEFGRANGLGSRIATFPTAARDTAFSGERFDVSLSFRSEADEIHVYSALTLGIVHYIQVLDEHSAAETTQVCKLGFRSRQILGSPAYGNERWLLVWDFENGVVAA